MPLTVFADIAPERSATGGALGVGALVVLALVVIGVVVLIVRSRRK